MTTKRKQRKQRWERDLYGNLVKGPWMLSKNVDIVTINGERQKWVAFYWGWEAAYGLTLTDLKKRVERRIASWTPTYAHDLAR